jgi:hypothetical protein
MTGARGCAVTPASPGGRQGGPQRRPRSVQSSDVREGDFPPEPAPEAPLYHAEQGILPGWGKCPASCSSASRNRENARKSVGEEGLESTNPRFFPDSALEYAGGGEIPYSRISCARASGPSWARVKQSPLSRPQGRGRVLGRCPRRDCRALTVRRHD